MKKVVVGSVNPVKIKAVELGFAEVWPNETWEVTGVNSDSGVSDQPMSDVESIKGARNRAMSAIKSVNDVDYGVGIEGGLQEIEDNWFDCGWMVVVDKRGRVGIGSTARIITPPKMMELIDQGIELGKVCDQVFGVNNCKHADGHFGLMTNNAITRTSGYVDGVIMALARFLHPKLF